MNPARRLLIGAIVVMAGALGYAGGRVAFRPSQMVSQPIAFNHLKHVEEAGLGCEVCHEGCQTGGHARLPALETCLQCHESSETDNPELRKLAEFAAAGQDVVFRKTFRLPDNVFYSHRRHAGIAALPCETCHGAIAKTTEPPARPLVRVTMEFCMDCHQEHAVAMDCTRCHR